MKYISIIFHKRAPLAVNWETLTEKRHPGDIFILVCSEVAYHKMSEPDKKNFSNILIVPDFNFDTIQLSLNIILNKVYKYGDKTHIANLSEFDMIVLAKIRDHFRDQFNVKGPGLDVIENFRDKLKMKFILGERGVRIPRYKKFDTIEYKLNPVKYLKEVESYIEYPMFTKPIDSAGSIGTAYIQDRASLISWFEEVQNSDQVYEIDEFIEGDLFHCDSIIQDGKIQFTFASQYLHPNADARSGKVLATMTLNPESDEYRRLAIFAENALNQFPVIPDGLTHMEIFKNQKNEFIFLEVAARPPGAKVSEMYEIRTNGIDIRWLHLRLNLGLSVADELSRLRDYRSWGPYASMAQLLSPANEGVLVERNQPVFATSQFTTEWNVQVGDHLSPNESLLDTLVSAIFWNDRYEDLVNDFYALDHQQLIKIAPNMKESSWISTHLYLMRDYASSQWNELTSGFCNLPYRFGKWVVTDNEGYFPKRSIASVSQTPATFFNRQGTCPANASAPQLPSPPTVPTIGR